MSKLTDPIVAEIYEEAWNDVLDEIVEFSNRLESHHNLNDDWHKGFRSCIQRYREYTVKSLHNEFDEEGTICEISECIRVLKKELSLMGTEKYKRNSAGMFHAIEVLETRKREKKISELEEKL